jgi:lipoate-protein ligase A
MAIDEHLLDRALADPSAGPSFRLYRWSRPTVSLGYHQRIVPPHWRTLAAQGLIDLVRRPTGGRAVLHGQDLSYALIWPAAPGSRRQAYGQACGWLCRAFADLGLPLRFGHQAPSRDRASCFATSTAADLVHHDGSKRIGSAQLWRKGALLQHGSILINPQRELWRTLFLEDPPTLAPLRIGTAAFEDLLERSASRCLPLAQGPVQLVSQSLLAGEWRAIGGAMARYRIHRGSGSID